jgi:hypothetical protein
MVEAVVGEVTRIINAETARMMGTASTPRFPFPGTHSFLGGGKKYIFNKFSICESGMKNQLRRKNLDCPSVPRAQ